MAGPAGNRPGQPGRRAVMASRSGSVRADPAFDVHKRGVEVLVAAWSPRRAGPHRRGNRRQKPTPSAVPAWPGAGRSGVPSPGDGGSSYFTKIFRTEPGVASPVEGQTTHSVHISYAGPPVGAAERLCARELPA